MEKLKAKPKIKKLELKEKMFQDRINLQKLYIDAKDYDEITLKDAIKMCLGYVESYIEICQKRNKF